MKSIFNPQIPQNIFLQQNHSVSSLRSRSDVRQDKYTSPGVRIASAQPVHPDTTECTQQTNTHMPRIQNPPRKGLKHLVAGRVSEVSYDRIEKLRAQSGKKGEKLSRSEVVSNLIETALQSHVDMQYGALLKPVIENAIDRRLRARDNRLAALLVRIAFETGQIRGIVTNNLAIQPGITEEIIQTVLTNSEKDAKSNISRRTPQIIEMLEDLKQWLTDEEENKPDR
jgi:hypothetical protein